MGRWQKIHIVPYITNNCLIGTAYTSSSPIILHAFNTMILHPFKVNVFDLSLRDEKNWQKINKTFLEIFGRLSIEFFFCISKKKNDGTNSFCVNVLHCYINM